MRRAEDGDHLRLEFVAAHAVGRRARTELREFGSQRGMTDRALKTLEFVAGEGEGGALDPLGERGRGLFLLTTMVDDLNVCAREGGRGVIFRVEKAHGTED